MSAQSAEFERAGGRAALLDIGQAAERLSVSQSFVRRLVLERRVPYFKVGKYIRFESADLDEWLAARRVEPLRRG
ncbi:MAG: helix-turn-helix domain-containing protein [Actinomycetota bacterium]